MSHIFICIVEEDCLFFENLESVYVYFSYYAVIEPNIGMMGTIGGKASHYLATVYKKLIFLFEEPLYPFFMGGLQTPNSYSVIVRDAYNSAQSRNISDSNYLPTMLPSDVAVFNSGHVKIRESVVIVAQIQNQILAMASIAQLFDSIAQLIFLQNLKSGVENFEVASCFGHQKLIPLFQENYVIESIFRNFPHFFHTLLF